jgi:hypothetical protein
MEARSLERMNQPRGIIELQAGFSSHQCAKHPIVWSRVPPNTDVSKRLASWKSLSFNGDTSNEPLMLAPKQRIFPSAVRHYNFAETPKSSQSNCKSLPVDSVLVRLNKLDLLDRGLRWLLLPSAVLATRRFSGRAYGLCFADLLAQSSRTRLRAVTSETDPRRE